MIDKNIGINDYLLGSGHNKEEGSSTAMRGRMLFGKTGRSRGRGGQLLLLPRRIAARLCPRRRTHSSTFESRYLRQHLGQQGGGPAFEELLLDDEADLDLLPDHYVGPLDHLDVAVLA